MSDEGRSATGKSAASGRRPRPWWEYETVEAWFRDVHGRVPVDTYLGLRRRMEATGCNFREAYQSLLDAGAIIPIDEALAGQPPASDHDMEDADSERSRPR